MDLIFSLLKQLSTSLPPSEFVLVLAVLCLITLLIVKQLGSMTGKKKGIMGLLFGSGDEDQEKRDKAQEAAKTVVDGINSKVDDLVSVDKFDSAIEKIIKSLDAINQHITDQDFSLKNSEVEVQLLRKDVQGLIENTAREISDIKHQLKVHDNMEQQNLDATKESLRRVQEFNQHIISQLDKLDELARSSFPEFKVFHKDLSRDISDLSRDIALIERSIQSQINTINTVKLR